MQLRIRLRLKDIIKILLGARILIEDNISSKVVEVKKDCDTYICR